MKTIRRLLREKGHDVWSVCPESTVFDALNEMADRDVGALVVLNDDGFLAGIVTERDYARKVILEGKSSPLTPVKDIMTSPVVCVQLDYTVETCLAIMTEKKVRYVPVISDDRVITIISIGDLVKSTIDDQKFIIDQMALYIHGDNRVHI